MKSTAQTLAALLLLSASTLIGEREARGQAPELAVVSAANYRPFLAPNSICAAFSTGMSTGFEAAQSLPLPVQLAGVTVLVNDRLAGLFFASGQQVNFLIPPDTPLGQTRIVIRGTDGVDRAATIYLFANQPAVFTKNMTGWGEAAAYIVHTDSALYAILYVSGITDFNPDSTALSIPGEAQIAPEWIGAAPGFVGVAQLNIPLPLAFDGRNLRGCRLTVNGAESNPFDLKPQ